MMNANPNEFSNPNTRITAYAAELYFFMVLVIGGILFTPWVLESYGFLPEGVSILFIMLGGLSPTFAAIITSRMVYGPSGLRMIFGAFKRSGFSKSWFIVPLILPFIIVLASFAFWFASGGLYTYPGAYLILIPILIQSLIMNVWEEIGWRGFALPALQKRYSALVSAIIVGIFWSLWHWPHFLVVDSQMLVNYGSVIIFIGVTILSSVIYTWLYNSTRGNLVIPWLFHAMTNSVFPVFFYSGVSGVIAPYMLLVFVIIAVMLIIIYNPATLSRSEKAVLD